MTIPVIDVFAGAGGLGEGFTAYRLARRARFNVALSIERDPAACSTLRLRKFFHAGTSVAARRDYYRFVRGELSEQALYEAHPRVSSHAMQSVWQTILGADTCPVEIRDARIAEALLGRRDWVLLGGPPCQAYSLVGRARNRGVTGYVAEEDERHYLYREYLQIIAAHWPAVFIMENVRGILSARVGGEPIFEKILGDLGDPAASLGRRISDGHAGGYRYRLLALTGERRPQDLFGEDVTRLDDFLIHGERHGLPQARHRVMVLGIRDDIEVIPEVLGEIAPVALGSVLDGLPRLRSGLSGGKDNPQAWLDSVREASRARWTTDAGKLGLTDVVARMRKVADSAKAPRSGRGSMFVRAAGSSGMRAEIVKSELATFLGDPRLGGWPNHETREHMSSDIARYLFATCFAEVRGVSPRLRDFPPDLLPDHRSAAKATGGSHFADRFRVQLASQPGGTIVSHIAKDGHAFIHHDPSQCRTLTVREAARLQTFPDNYYFCGNRTEQYVQVGNAVPPFLARAIAAIVFGLLGKGDVNITQPRRGIPTNALDALKSDAP